MPLKLNVGLSKKVGQPDYGSLGVSCHVELDLDGSLLTEDLDGFHRRVRSAYVACWQAVSDELAQRCDAGDNTNGDGDDHQNQPLANGRSEGRPSNGNGRRPSEKQLDYANQLARQIRGMGVRRLENLVQSMYEKSLDELTSLEVSGLIDTLKAIKDGRVSLAAAMEAASP